MKDISKTIDGVGIHHDPLWRIKKTIYGQNQEIQFFFVNTYISMDAQRAKEQSTFKSYASTTTCKEKLREW